MILISKDYRTAIEIRMVKLVETRAGFSIVAFGGNEQAATEMARYNDKDAAEDAYLAILEDWQRGCACHDIQHAENRE